MSEQQTWGDPPLTDREMAVMTTAQKRGGIESVQHPEAISLAIRSLMGMTMDRMFLLTQEGERAIAAARRDRFGE